ncbi:hypothetical protein [Methylobacterium sp. WL64]|nr:hypothetical protein [Methylobacterium sp. WL64]
MFRVLLTILTVLAVLTARLVLKLPLIPYRAVRGMVRGLFAPA